MTYAEKLAAGLCVRCGEVEPEPGCTACRACLDSVNARRTGGGAISRPRPLGPFNVCCQAHGFHRFDCAEPNVKQHAGPLLLSRLA